MIISFIIVIIPICLDIEALFRLNTDISGFHSVCFCCKYNGKDQMVAPAILGAAGNKGLEK